MVTTASLVDLARRFVLRPGESVESVTEFADGPAAFVVTPARSLWIRSVRDWLAAERLLWVSAVVVVTREDQDAVPAHRRVFLLPDDGDPVDLGDPAQVADLGRRVRDGSLGAEAFAEILIECQWPVGGVRVLVTDPERPPANPPAGADGLAKLQPLRMWDDEHDDRWVAFCALRAEEASTEVTLWSVRIPADGVARWVRRLL